MKNTIQNAVERFTTCPDTESEQSFIRIVVILVIIGYLHFSGAYRLTTGHVFLLFSWISLANAIGIVAWVFLYPRKLVGRRIYSLLSDHAFVTMLMLFGEEKSIVLFPVYIWITIGYGFRYGVKYLYLNVGMSVAMFSSLMFMTNYWGTEALAFSIGVLLSLIVVPMYTTKLINNLRSAIARADKANQAKDRFLAIMSHEMRTPLNGILGYLELIQKENLTTPAKSYLKPLMQSADQLLRDINNLLDISKIEAGKLVIDSKPMDLRKTVESVVSILTPQAEEKGLALRSVSNRICRH